MEVHHHSHTTNTDIHRGRKKWTHYFWEFLMLFLAVFCGFLAEYTLEHKIEKDREKQFVKSLANDIKADIVHLTMIIDRRTQKIERLDSVFSLMNSTDVALHGSAIYFNAIHTARLVDIRFMPNIGTLQQLKNSGALRLIRNRAVADSIARYDVGIRNLETLSEQEALIAHEYRTAAKNIFDTRVYDKMLDENNIASRPDGNPALLPFSKKELYELNFFIHSTKTVTKGIRRDAMNLLQQAHNLLALINKSYQLE